MGNIVEKWEFSFRFLREKCEDGTLTADGGATAEAGEGEKVPPAGGDCAVIGNGGFACLTRCYSFDDILPRKEHVADENFSE